MKTEKEETLRKFKRIETNINEKTLFLIIAGVEVEIPLGHLIDYYLFFKELKLSHCIATIKRKIDEIEKLEEVYFLFKDFCLKHENEIIRTWFSSKAQKVEIFQPTTFDSSFALSLFNKMKKMEIEYEKMEKMIELDVFFGNVWMHLRKYQLSKMIKINRHQDFEGVGSNKDLKVEYYFKKLFDERKTKFNLTLISTDKKEFKVHKEILILRFDFFFRLFNFRGLEVTEYEKTGKITLVDLMSSDVVECLISFAYLGELDVKNEDISAISTFCKLLIFCDQFNEKELMKRVRREFTDFVNIFHTKQEEKNSSLKILSGLSSYLVGNDKVLGIIVPLIHKLGVKINGVNEFIDELILQSLKIKEESKEEFINEKMILKEEIENHMNEKKKLHERNLELEKMISEMNEKDDKGVGKGQIREREENEEEKEEIKKEQPKRKKRKYNRK